jgi:hypothetical protein
MWDHQTDIRTNTITPAKMRENENLNEQITEHFEDGIAGLSHKDHHGLAKPLAHILGYDLDQKAPCWLESIALAQTRFANQHEFEASSIW